VRDEKGNIVGHYPLLYGPHLAAFVEHAVETVRHNQQKYGLRADALSLVLEIDGSRVQTVEAR